jgi:DNA segregation ATPase FtsK/SpoIIIE, S-DNA-T family
VSKAPSLNHIRSLFAEFRKHVSDVASREEQLLRDTARQRALAVRASTQGQGRQNDEAVLRRMELTERHRLDLERAERRAEQRKQRIQKSTVECRRRITQGLDQQDGRAVFGFQKATLDAERQRELDIATAGNNYANLTAEASEVGAALQASHTQLLAVLGGFQRFRRWFSPGHPGATPDTGSDESALLASARSAQQALETSVEQARSIFPSGVVRFLPPWLVWGLVVVIAVSTIPGLREKTGVPASQAFTAQLFAGVLAGLALLVRLWVFFQLRPVAIQAAQTLSAARNCLSAAHERIAARYQTETGEAHARFTSTTQAIRDRWSAHESAMEVARAGAVQKLQAKGARAMETHERAQAKRIPCLAERHAAETEALERAIAGERERWTSREQSDLARIETSASVQWTCLVADWEKGLLPLKRLFAEIAELGVGAGDSWDSPDWSSWQPPAAYPGAPEIGTLAIRLKAVSSVWPTDPRLALPEPENRVIPLWLAYPEDGAVVIESDQAGSSMVGDWLNNMALRLLCQMPPGRLKVTILDPVGLGRTFASLMHLSDYAEAKGGAGQRIWTETSEIEERLTELTQQMEKVLQMYLRNEFANLVEYNARAGSIAEHHHLLIVTGFPVNFTESSARRLLNLVTNGGRCGIITLLHWDRRLPTPPGFVAEDLAVSGIRLLTSGSEVTAMPPLGPGLRITPGLPPSPALATELLHRIGRASRDANKVVVPFEVVAPPPAEYWTESTAEEIRVPLGRTGASKLQYLSLGRGTRQHALISGKTGSGKSNLLHVLVTNLALRCSPDELEFYLVDFKKGVEFKAYATAQLPHARVVAIESDREFGLSVLERIDLELRRRGGLFRDLGVQDLPGYRQAGGRQPMPRCLLLVDEFQEYFVEEDRIAQEAAVLLDRIVRQGRAFGIHVILASQTLGGTYALARATLGQMAVRIAFHCDEADAYLIMGDENSAPRLLSRPGEGIYNDSAGAREANSPFQAVWLPDETRDRYLAEIQKLAAAPAWAGTAPVVFEGSAPASMMDNPLLQELLAFHPTQLPVTPVAWLGAPNSIKGPTAAEFSRAGGSNLLLVGQREETALALVLSSLISLATQHPPGLARFILVDTTAPGTPRHQLLEYLCSILPQSIERIPPGRVPAAIVALQTELDDRNASGSQERPNVFLVVLGLQHCKKLKPDDSFGFSTDSSDTSDNAAAPFQRLYIEGPAQGIHVMVQVDSYNNVNRFLGRKGLSEFELRVLLQMSASDSSSLCDQPTASNLGLHGGLFYNDREGRVETFRPYSLPEEGWLASLAERWGTPVQGHR